MKASKLKIFSNVTCELLVEAKELNLHPTPTEEHRPTDYKNPPVTATFQIKDFNFSCKNQIYFTQDEIKEMYRAVTTGKAVVFAGKYNASPHKIFNSPTYIDRPGALDRLLEICKGESFAYAILPVSECQKFIHLDFENK